MSTRLEHRYTLEEYLALELAGEEKHEFRDGGVWCMSGASLEHSLIVMNMGTEVRLQLRGRGCLSLPFGYARQSSRLPAVSLSRLDGVVRRAVD